jgi:hypothetical protein
MDDDNIINEELQSESKPRGKDKMNKSTDAVVEEKTGRTPLFRAMMALLVVVSAVVSLFLLFLFVVYVVPVLQEKATKQKTAVIYNEELRKDPVYKKQITQMSKDVQRMRTKYVAYTSGQSYIIINTTENRFFLYKNKKLVRTGFCSSGSYIKLQTEGNKHLRLQKENGLFLGRKRILYGKNQTGHFLKKDFPFLPPMLSRDLSTGSSGIMPSL